MTGLRLQAPRRIPNRMQPRGQHRPHSGPQAQEPASPSHRGGRGGWAARSLGARAPSQGPEGSTGRRGPPRLQLAVMGLGSMSEPGQGVQRGWQSGGQYGNGSSCPAEGLHLPRLNGPRSPAPPPPHNASLVPRAGSLGGKQGTIQSCPVPANWTGSWAIPRGLVDPSQVSEAPRLQAWKTRLETLHSLPFLGPGPPAPRLATPAGPGLTGAVGPGLTVELLEREGPKEAAKALHSLGTLPRHQ